MRGGVQVDILFNYTEQYDNDDDDVYVKSLCKLKKQEPKPKKNG